jgi:uncharacterized protein (AIM24 family)
MSDVRYLIEENELTMFVPPGQTVNCEPGAMYISQPGMVLETDLSIRKGVKRWFSGESFATTNYTNKTQQEQFIAFSQSYSGTVIPIEVNESEVNFQRGSYLAGFGQLEISLKLIKGLAAGFFGGEGFFFQKISGRGTVFAHGGGRIKTFDLAFGEELILDTGCLMGYESTVTYTAIRVKGFKNMVFGGEGLANTKVTGPGKIWVQSIPFSRLADSIVSASNNDSEGGTGVLSSIGDIIKIFT